MSAPQTDPKKQVKRHRGPLVIVGTVVAIVLVALYAMIGNVVDEGGAPEGADTQIDGRTGEEVTQ